MIRLITSAVVGLLAFSHLHAYAEDRTPRPKSVGVAVALGLDPLPADALFYAGKTTQGTFNALLGAAGGFMFWYGLVDRLTHTDTGCVCSDLSCCDFNNLRSGLLIAGGSILYFPSLLWDGIGGISGVKKHNKELQKENTSGRLVQPILALRSDGFFLGGELKF